MFYNIDLELFRFLNFIANRYFYPNILLIISNIFNISNFVFYYIFVFALLIIFAKKIHKDQKNSFLDLYQKLFEIGFCYSFIGFLYAFLKFFINSKRPFCSLQEWEYISVANLAHERCLSGFPSSHTALAFFLVFYLWNYTKNIYQKIILITLVILVAISRISLAMHFPSQILASLLIVYILIRISYRVCNLQSVKTYIIMPLGNLVYKLFF
jgi:membrane-associated phospholipid phosphatase